MKALQAAEFPRHSLCLLPLYSKPSISTALSLAAPGQVFWPGDLASPLPFSGASRCQRGDDCSCWRHHVWRRSALAMSILADNLAQSQALPLLCLSDNLWRPCIVIGEAGAPLTQLRAAVLRVQLALQQAQLFLVFSIGLLQCCHQLLLSCHLRQDLSCREPPSTDQNFHAQAAARCSHARK